MQEKVYSDKIISFYFIILKIDLEDFNFCKNMHAIAYCCCSFIANIVVPNAKNKII